MPAELKNNPAEKHFFSDKGLDRALRFAKGAEIWCKSGIAFWGVIALVGVAAMGLHALGLGIPAIVGASTVGMSALMCGKSLLLERLFHSLHKKGMSAREDRYKQKGVSPAPELHYLPFRHKPITPSFNAKATFERMEEVFRRHLGPKDNLKPAAPDANSRPR